MQASRHLVQAPGAVEHNRLEVSSFRPGGAGSLPPPTPSGARVTQAEAEARDSLAAEPLLSVAAQRPAWSRLGASSRLRSTEGCSGTPRLVSGMHQAVPRAPFPGLVRRAVTESLLQSLEGSCYSQPRLPEAKPKSQRGFSNLLKNSEPESRRAWGPTLAA